MKKKNYIETFFEDFRFVLEDDTKTVIVEIDREEIDQFIFCYGDDCRNVKYLKLSACEYLQEQDGIVRQPI